VSDTYSDVDRAVDVNNVMAWQDRIDGWLQIMAYKRRSYDLLADCDRILDVGTGTGTDLVELGPGTVGVDRSAAMCAKARSRAALVVRADAVALPFPDRHFAGTRADRLVQHLGDPRTGIAELIRVTATGGRIVICDPDQSTLRISVPGVPTDLLDRVRRLRRDIGYRNGTLAGQLPDLLLGMGLADVTVDAFPLLLTDPDNAFGLPTWVRGWRDRGPFSADDEREWDAGVDRSRRRGGFVYALLYFVVSGRRVVAARG
jgi:SAM-dependent methyltransferase